MTKAEYRKWFGEQRTSAKEVAREEFKKYPQAKRCCVPILPPIIAMPLERTFFYRLRPHEDVDYSEIIYGITNANEEVIHLMEGELWRHFMIEVEGQGKEQ